ncbi:hypothetical protein PMKS-002737 [Pichia membranifaciens]|uniref:Uncharacterized protein n=1 Tax=Pichia membranifaciens TaxID=4926 RepID=A0A1Q2YIA7_9ASCO|nr:hypothetical protein PMKS-002737 [Pichia membranifaciens]
MAITRSRNAPKKVAGDIVAPSSKLHNAEETVATSSCNLNVDKTESSTDRVVKPKKLVRQPRKAEKNNCPPKPKPGDEDLPNWRDMKTGSDIIKSEIFRSAKSEKAEMAQKYKKILKYGNIRAPKLSDDKTLKKVLGEIVDKNKELIFWDYFSKRLQAEGYGNAVFLENECRLQAHEVTSTQRDNLIKQKEQKEGSQAEVKTERGVEDAKDALGKYTKINLMKAAVDTDLQKLLQEVSNNSEKYSAVNEENAFSGLKLVDFTTIRNFNNEKA